MHYLFVVDTNEVIENPINIVQFMTGFSKEKDDPVLDEILKEEKKYRFESLFYVERGQRGRVDGNIMKDSMDFFIGKLNYSDSGNMGNIFDYDDCWSQVGNKEQFEINDEPGKYNSICFCDDRQKEYIIFSNELKKRKLDATRKNEYSFSITFSEKPSAKDIEILKRRAFKWNEYNDLKEKLLNRTLTSYGSNRIDITGFRLITVTHEEQEV